MSQRRRKPRAASAEEEDRRQYTASGQTMEDLDEQYPNRPKNHSRTFPFSVLYKDLFNPLNESKKQPGSAATRTRHGHGRGLSKLSPYEHRRNIIDRFISRWRSEVGDDFFPVLRLILPSSDRERGMYGLKESAIGRLLVKLMGIDRHSEDGSSIINWKLPSLSTAGRAGAGAAGDFAGRCYQVLSKRPMRIEPGDMHIAEVNEMLDKLTAASGEKERLPIFEQFYQRMNAEELLWLIRIILKQLKIGATEKTIFELWHPDAQTLFGVTSSLRKVCWDLYDPNVRLTSAQTGITPMQCFQPQLAANPLATSFQKMVEKLHSSTGTAEDDEYWIEEKLDGERMQLHMIEDEDTPGGKRFCFWSRNVHNYTYLYGDSFYSESSSLTRHLKNAFAPGVRNIILDGEMITWDPQIDKVLKFGTLKTAAIEGLRNPHKDDAPRPVLRVFDIVYLNDQPLTQYTLRDRRNALARAVPGVPGRLEILEYTKATSSEAIEPMLRKIVSDASEGIVIKNPGSMYKVDDRNTDWIKVKPDYMTEFGESVDVLIIGGYFGSGHRGGRLSAFLCGLRASENDIRAGADEEMCYSFLRVGGGFRAEDFAEIQHLTQGKWRDWDPQKPPTKYIKIAGGGRAPYDRPDVWIRPSESIVITVKAASLNDTTTFATNYTLRFPRFKGIRQDRSWNSAEDMGGLEELRTKLLQRQEEKEMQIESRKRHPAKRARKEIVIAGQDVAPVAFAGPRTKVFDGLEFCILTDCTQPVRKSKTQLEMLVKENGGRISQRAAPGTEMILIAEKKVVKVASLLKAGDVDIVRPKWLLDCVGQNNDGNNKFLLPYETGHLFCATPSTRDAAAANTDDYGDSYARDLNVQELQDLLRGMPKHEEKIGAPLFDKDTFLRQLADHGHEDLGGNNLVGHLFRGAAVHFATENDSNNDERTLKMLRMKNRVRFGGGRVVEDLEDRSITQVVVLGGGNEGEEMRIAARVRAVISRRTPVPFVVTGDWVEDCWGNRTRVDEERYAPL
ncbi:DNA ligase [Biscogniauxia mediterranea]|nr:DNA ligase [Biscogniauxia mediterranea]